MDFQDVINDNALNEGHMKELVELNNLEGITVWGQNQEVLEKQALDELQLLRQNKEDGELSDTKGDSGLKKKHIDAPVLDVSSYIKRQEELQRQRNIKRCSSISNRSKSLADKISKSQFNPINKKESQKRKTCQESRRSNKKMKNETIVKSDEDNTKEEMIKRNCKTETIVKPDDSDSEYIPSEEDSDYEPESTITQRKKYSSESKKKHQPALLDDAYMQNFKKRLAKYYDDIYDRNKLHLANEQDVEIRPGLRITQKIWNSLYSYQKEGVTWLWDLHQKSSGGLLGDEMGLGKTVQVITFLFALGYSNVSSCGARYLGLGPTIIVCPSTVIHQWLKHFHEWSPEFRVTVLHSSGSFKGNPLNLIKDMNENKAIIITTYQGILKYRSVLIDYQWHYIILDEGHKIRNSCAKISKAVKEIKTPHRIVLTGSPMQNNLQELWSLFEFINPGILGTLPVFLEQFANPIMQGGYANATKSQEALAASMANTLKNRISPYFLRRAKNDVREDIKLPNKTEQVLFCSMTTEQVDLYKGYLMSDHVSNILGKGDKNWFSENSTRANVLMSITTLRKICNHPDIYSREVDVDTEVDNKTEKDCYGYYKRSGKMAVVAGLLKIWKVQGHRVLLFTQSRYMIKIFESFLKKYCYKYLKMDGSTLVASRQIMIDRFNQDTNYHVFLLTTRVGGLGVNLTGADRVIIYDPDWNPATDTQARERAWRIGQDRQVTIYRLLSAGTIEEKIYQRQVWKQLLSNKVLLDPKTQRFFKNSDLHDLFSLQEDFGSNPETANIFKNSKVCIDTKVREKPSIEFSDDKIVKMKELAAKIAKNISSQKDEPTKSDEQLVLENEKKMKVAKKRELKQLTPMELRQYNRDKMNLKEDETANKLDDLETEVSFTKALIISELTSGIYKEGKSDADKAVEKYETLTEIFAKPKKHKKSASDKNIVDTSGMIDGEFVEGLVKREEKKIKVKETRKTESQDQYVLEKLFTRKGVCSALQHGSIVQEDTNPHTSIRTQMEIKERTEKALAALRRSSKTKW